MNQDDMSPDQEEHLEEIIDDVADRLDDKYRKGQREHNGNLFELDAEDLAEETLDELIDAFTYIKTCLDQIRALKAENDELKEKLKECGSLS